MRGQVLDQSTMAPLMAANVYSSDERGKPLSPIKGTTTDQNGNFSFDAKSKYISISYIGYQKMTTPTTTGFTVFELLPMEQSLPTVEVRPKGITLLGFGFALISILKLLKK